MQIMRFLYIDKDGKDQRYDSLRSIEEAVPRTGEFVLLPGMLTLEIVSVVHCRAVPGVPSNSLILLYSKPAPQYLTERACRGMHQ